MHSGNRRILNAVWGVTALALVMVLAGCSSAAGGGGTAAPLPDATSEEGGPVQSTQSTTPTPAPEDDDVPIPKADEEDPRSSLPEGDDSNVASPKKEKDVVKPAELTAGTVVTEEQIAQSGGVDAFFWAEEISDATFARMEGKSFGADCTVPRSDLRYLKVLHVDAEGTTKVGEMVVNAALADEVVDIFRQLYDAKWPIKKMHLVDDYNGSDDASCADGNSSAFNYRMASNANVLSNHSFGTAIDINTFENPYYVPSSGYVYPPEAARYVDRSLQEPYMIHPGDLCYQLFTERGWTWGGDWSHINDYQHFEKPL